MAIIHFGGNESVTVDEDAASVEDAIRKAREDRTTFVQLNVKGGGKTWVNADRIVRFTGN